MSTKLKMGIVQPQLKSDSSNIVTTLPDFVSNVTGLLNGAPYIEYGKIVDFSLAPDAKSMIVFNSNSADFNYEISSTPVNPTALTIRFVVTYDNNAIQVFNLFNVGTASSSLTLDMITVDRDMRKAWVIGKRSTGGIVRSELALSTSYDVVSATMRTQNNSAASNGTANAVLNMSRIAKT